MTFTAYLPGRLSPAAKNFLVEVNEASGKDWALAYARLFVGDHHGSHVTHIAREDQESIEGELTFLWREGDPEERFQRFGRRR